MRMRMNNSKQNSLQCVELQLPHIYVAKTKTMETLMLWGFYVCMLFIHYIATATV